MLFSILLNKSSFVRNVLIRLIITCSVVLLLFSHIIINQLDIKIVLQIWADEGNTVKKINKNIKKLLFRQALKHISLFLK